MWRSRRIGTSGDPTGPTYDAPVIPTRGAVWDGTQLFVTDELEVREPGPGEATVDVLASGICHSDLNVIDGTRGGGPPPVVLGHEAAGVVRRVGDGVDTVAPGEAIVVGTAVPCGSCRACTSGRGPECRDAFAVDASPFRWRGHPVHGYANTSSWAAAITVRASQLVAAPGIPPASAALIGCAVSTGYGVVRNVASVREGDVVAVFGIGGIGVNVLQTARLSGAARILAVDVNPAKRQAAASFGADDFLVLPRAGRAEALAELVREAAGGPIDVAVECSGALVAIDAAIRCTGRGGTTALVGIPPAGQAVPFDMDALLHNRRIVGSFNGIIDLQRDLAAIIEHVRRGELELDAQVSQVWPLDEIDAAIAAVRNGSVIRAVLDHAA
jgi:S-(hydroxymethyl)glutathione dehydrogenase/alcohol dehydrogenase